MNFTEYFNFLYSKLECTQTELCNASNLSAPVISRYLSGDRSPAAESEQLKSLAMGIHQVAIAKQLDSSEFEYDNLLLEFNKAVWQKEAIYNSFVASFNEIIDQFSINMKELANAMNFDVSYLYRVKSGERHPIDLNHFCDLIAEYVASDKTSESDLDIGSSLFGCSAAELSNSAFYKKAVITFLTEVSEDSEDIPEMSGFLNKMDEFNLDEYIKVIHFDDINIPNIPFQLPSTKYYYGVEQMRKAELDFLKSTVLGKSKEPVFMFSDMPMLEMAEDMDFGKKWMFGIAMMLKKGLHLNIIHNLNRPMAELMLGLEAWIPIYMTGQVSPYHLADYENDIFHQINYCSGNAALMGECIEGNYKDGRYYVTNNKSEITYFRKKTNALLKKAKPLMDIYTIDDKDSFNDFISNAIGIKANRRIISLALPDCTIPDSILDKHLSGLSPDEKTVIKNHIASTKAFSDVVTIENTLTYDICEISKDDYEKNPVKLNFPMLFSDFEAPLSYDDYLAHLHATKAYANTHSNFILNEVDAIPFSNIKITIVHGNYFVVSKVKSPNIHFVIHHPKMLAGMENFYLAYKD